ncbi:hypothetical protein [Streptomyces sp. T028]|uniref:hypothetical protein n=1 Tax=Streptomyces sp. T028 TaxID=3394379 RepID=UPI003A85972D
MTSAQPQSMPTPQQERQSPPGDEQQQAGGRVMHLHTAHPRVPIPYVTPGDMFTRARSGTSRLPSPRKLAFYGALGAMAAVEVLEWPVALAIGAATEVITREQRGNIPREQRETQRPDTEPSAGAQASGPSST